MRTGSWSEALGSRVNVKAGSIVVRCLRFDELVAFWQAALGYLPREPPRDGWVVLMDPTGAGPNISLDRVGADRLPQLGDLRDRRARRGIARLAAGERSLRSLFPDWRTPATVSRRRGPAYVEAVTQTDWMPTDERAG